MSILLLSIQLKFTTSPGPPTHTTEDIRTLLKANFSSILRLSHTSSMPLSPRLPLLLLRVRCLLPRHLLLHLFVRGDLEGGVLSFCMYTRCILPIQQREIRPVCQDPTAGAMNRRALYGSGSIESCREEGSMRRSFSSFLTFTPVNFRVSGGAIREEESEGNRRLRRGEEEQQGGE